MNADFLFLEKAPNIYIDYLMFLPTKHATFELKTPQVPVSIEQRFYNEQGTEFK